MTKADFQLQGVGDPRLAIHATSHLPAWLWAPDGTRTLWANPVGADVFGAANASALASRNFGPADPHRRQVVQLAGRLSYAGTVRLERLRGFGAALGRLVTCACTRLHFPDGTDGILVTATEPVGRGMPLVERLQRLVEGIDTPIAAFARDGLFVGASDAARSLLGFHNLTEAGLDTARSDALRDGRVETPIGLGHMVLQRVGSGSDVGLVALLVPGTAHHPVPSLNPPVLETSPEPAALVTPAITPTEAVAPIEHLVVAPLTELAPDHIGTVPTTESENTHVAQQLVAHDEPVTLPPDKPYPGLIEAEPDLPAMIEAPPAYEQPAAANEAPAEFALFDAFDEPAAEIVGEPVKTVAEEPVVAPAQPHDIAAPADVEPQRQLELPPSAKPSDEPSPDVEAVEPSPYVEAAADEPSPPPAPNTSSALEPPPAPPQAISTPPATSDTAPMPSWTDESTAQARRHPLRFMWQMDADGRFTLGSDEFTRLIGTRTAAGFGRLWSEIAEVFGLDPEGRVAKAVATRDTWSGITLHWPVDGPDARLPVELSGLPIYDRARNFAGYRGFGVCRDLEGLTQLAARRRHEFLFSETPHPLSAAASSPDATPAIPESSQPPAEPEAPVETPKNVAQNVLPFRSANDLKSPSLTPVENNAFNELARQLSARLESDPITGEPEAVTAEPFAPDASETIGPRADWLIQPEPPARGDSARDRQLFDLLPTGVMIYRLDRLLYANPAFLARVGHDNLHTLEEAGGLDALLIESGVSAASSTSGSGTPVTISPARQASDAQRTQTAANLFSIAWDGEPAHALICAHAPVAVEPAPDAAPVPSAVGHATAEELGAILDTTAEGIVMFDETGRITACNRSAEALFAHTGENLTQLNLGDLFAPESQPAVRDYLNAVRGAGAASLLEHGREVLGRVRDGGLIPLSMTMGRTQADGPNFFAVFRDLSQARKIETELLSARRQTDRAANAKADVLARISHEVRTPLNAIIGFAEVMIGGKFGALGNERYAEYMKDIRASGERVIAFIDDLLDLSRIETGKLDLAFVNQNLNELVEQCVAVMQPQANRERIIIRTSLAHTLPPVVADARALRQITLNLIGNSIHLANAGGQVIVSTAVSDFGDVVLRVRDTGHGLNDNEVAAAMEPFGTHAPLDQASEGSGVNLSLTKALVEANRAQFQIKTGQHSGTLIEVVFAQAKALA